MKYNAIWSKMLLQRYKINHLTCRNNIPKRGKENCQGSTLCIAFNSTQNKVCEFKATTKIRAHNHFGGFSLIIYEL